MTSAARSGLLLGFSALLAACGSRSQLRDAGAASAGGGGSGPTTNSASSSGGGGSGGQGDVGGSGGMLSGCIVDGAPIGLAGTDGYGTSNPIFVAPVQVDGTTLVAAWNAVVGPKNNPTELRHSSFQPWGTWPADGTIGPSYLAEYDGEREFYAAPSFTDFSLVFAPPQLGAGLTYVSQLVPGKGTLGVNENIVSGPASPRFLERSTDPHVHLLGFETVASLAAPRVFNLIQRTDTVAAEVLTANLGCASDGIVAGAAAFGDSFIIAFSSGSGFNDPACAGGGALGTAQRLFTARVNKDGKVEPGQEIKAASSGGRIGNVKVVPRLDGAWLTWVETGSDKVQVIRLDPAGQAAAGPFVVPFFGEAASLSATSLGDRLAIAWTFSPTEVSPSVQVRIIDPAGNLAAQTELIVSSIAPGRTALLGSPSEKALLLSWVEFSNASPSIIRLARLACTLP